VAAPQRLRFAAENQLTSQTSCLLGRNVRFAFQPAPAGSRRITKSGCRLLELTCPVYEQIVNRIKAKLQRAWEGPYEIKKEAFDRGVKRKQLLDGGIIKYRADDRLTRKDRVAINCFSRDGGAGRT
jgi:hypothetical protein